MRAASPLGTAIVLGFGLGAFVDGIVFHQLLQWHAMLSARIPPETLSAKSLNMFWDGLFHAVAWVVTLAGVVRLWSLRARRPEPLPRAVLAGGLLAGWGIFNVAEGVLDHLVLGLHNVKENSDVALAWNLGFLAFSALLVAAGLALARRARPVPTRPVPVRDIVQQPVH
jgi:uncharacterized membrane protein